MSFSAGMFYTHKFSVTAVVSITKGRVVISRGWVSSYLRIITIVIVYGSRWFASLKSKLIKIPEDLFCSVSIIPDLVCILLLHMSRSERQPLNVKNKLQRQCGGFYVLFQPSCKHP